MIVSSNEVLALSNRGMTPSEIDEALDLDGGTARQTMVGIWMRDKDDALRARASRREERLREKELREAGAA